MSTTTVLPLHPVAEPKCPSWCAGEAHIEGTGSHVGAPVQLAPPEGMSPTTDIPLLSVRIALGHEEELRGEPPRFWLSDADGSAELDSPAALGSLILGLEDFALRLRGLQHRYDTVIVGGAEEAVELVESPTHPLELVVPCPPWCQYRDEEEHTPTGLLTEHFHAAPEFSMALELHGSAAESLELGLEHMGHAELPQLDLTVGGSKKWRHVSLTFDEADQLRRAINDFIAKGREYAHPEAVASLRELIDYCDVRIVEYEGSVPGFTGYAVGDTRQGGPVWVTLPKGLPGPCAESWVKHLLADIHETQPEATAKDGTGVRQAGDVPVPAWLQRTAA
ncbi:DUF6907 domain-containing protein [Streptomyces sp. NPDC050516]|uniref:DUF6907 domain-containing protein n=1 Tax=Streptomyces sp. NPDC050516 TaxID=3365621 RepID=UPI00378FCA07